MLGLTCVAVAPGCQLIPADTGLGLDVVMNGAWMVDHYGGEGLAGRVVAQ